MANILRQQDLMGVAFPAHDGESLRTLAIRGHPVRMVLCDKVAGISAQTCTPSKLIQVRERSVDRLQNDPLGVDALCGEYVEDFVTASTGSVDMDGYSQAGFALGSCRRRQDLFFLRVDRAAATDFLQ